MFDENMEREIIDKLLKSDKLKEIIGINSKSIKEKDNLSPEFKTEILNTLNSVDTWTKLKTKNPEEIIITKKLIESNKHKIYLYTFQEYLGSKNSVLLSDEKFGIGDNIAFFKEDINILDKIQNKLKRSDYLFLLDEIQKNTIKKNSIIKILYFFMNNYERMSEYLESNNIKGLIKEMSNQSSKIFIKELINYQNKTNDLFFYSTIDPANIDEYKPKNPDDVKDLIKTALTSGYDVDQHLFNIYLLQNYIINSYEFEGIEKYASHTILVTGTKAGKTTIAQKIGVVADGINVTTSNLLGFASSDKINKGSLNTIQKPLFIDEFEDLNNKENFFSGALSLIEKGETTTMKGMATIKTKYQNSFIFNSNPLFEQEESENKGLGLYKLILSINKNTLALGSRIGIIYYNPDTKSAELKQQLDPLLLENSVKILDSLKKYVSKWFLELLNDKNIIDWLEKPFDNEYLDKLKKLEHLFQEIPELFKFIQGFKFNYRHLRGSALKLALWDAEFIYKKLNNQDLSIDEILFLSDQKLKYLQEINYKSFNSFNKSDTLGLKEIIIEETFDDSLSKLKKVDKIILTCLYFYKLENHDDKVIMIKDLRDNFNNIRDYLDIPIKKRYFSKILEWFRQSFKHIKPILNYNFGIDFMETNITNESDFDNFKIIISDENKYETNFAKNFLAKLKDFKIFPYFPYFLEEKIGKSKIKNAKNPYGNYGNYGKNKLNSSNTEKTVKKEVKKEVLLDLFKLQNEISKKFLKGYFDNIFKLEALLEKLKREGIIYEISKDIYKKTP